MRNHSDFSQSPSVYAQTYECLFPIAGMNWQIRIIHYHLFYYANRIFLKFCVIELNIVLKMKLIERKKYFF